MEKNKETIYQEMLEAFTRASGYLPSPSCDLAARLSAAAAQLESLYHQAEWVMEQSFPQTARGIYLDRHAQLRGLRRSVATCARGSLRFGLKDALEQSVPIPSGTVCMTKNGLRFITTGDAEIPAGQLFTDVDAKAAEPGKSGNAAPGTITVLSAMPAGVQACTNPLAFSGGEDQEEDEALRQRLLDSYRRLPNGANAAYYEQTALSFPEVAAAKAVGRPRGVGSVDVYITSRGGIPDSELLAKVNRFMQEQREIAVDLQVKAARTISISLSVYVKPAAGFAFSQAKADAEAVLRNFFTGDKLGEKVMLVRLGDLLYHLESVENYRISYPTEDTEAEPTVLPVLGNLTVLPWEA